MKIFTRCPCCSNIMLHHLDRDREYWFCRECWQEMPDLEVVKENRYNQQNQIVNLSIGLSKRKNPVLI